MRVVADFERNCFNINFQLIQSVYDQLKDLVTDDHIATAKTLVEWIGLVGTPTVSLLGFRKWRKGRKIKTATKIVTRDGSAVYTISVEDGNTITIPAPVYDLSNDSKVARAERAIVRPLLSGGIDTFEVRSEGKVVETISQEEVPFFGDTGIREDDLDNPPQGDALGCHQNRSLGGMGSNFGLTTPSRSWSTRRRFIAMSSVSNR